MVWLYPSPTKRGRGRGSSSPVRILPVTVPASTERGDGRKRRLFIYVCSTRSRRNTYNVWDKIKSHLRGCILYINGDESTQDEHMDIARVSSSFLTVFCNVQNACTVDNWRKLTPGKVFGAIKSSKIEGDWEERTRAKRSSWGQKFIEALKG